MLSFVVSVGWESQLNRNTFDFRNADYESIGNAIRSINWNDTLIAYPDARDLYRFLVCVLHELMYEYIPLKKVSIEGIRIPQHILNLTQQKERLWKEMRNNPQSKAKYERVSQWLKRECNKYYAIVERKIIVNGKLKDLYRYISSGTRDKCKPTTALLYDKGCIITCETERAQLFARSFFSYFTTDDGKLPAVSSPYPNPVHAFPVIDFDVNMIASLINKWSISYSRTPDGLPMNFLKEISSVVAIPICIIFKRSLLTGEVPEFWKFAIVIPLPKKFPHNVVDNFRGVSITSFACRVFEKIISTYILKYSLSNEIMPREQHGFLKNRSRETAVLKALNDWTIALYKMKNIDVIYFDFAKAFDRVSHSKLLYKLSSMGFPNHITKWLQNWLVNRKFVVRCQNSFSDVYEVPSSVPQGSVLGPILFNLYTADLAIELQKLSNISFQLYADDIKIYNCYNSYDNQNEQASLQRAVDTVNRWSELWQLPLSANKCQVLYLGKNNSKMDYSIGTTTLRKVSEVRDLGFIIDRKLDFSKHVKCM